MVIFFYFAISNFTLFQMKTNKFKGSIQTTDIRSSNESVIVCILA